MLTTDSGREEVAKGSKGSGQSFEGLTGNENEKAKRGETA
jgi:hypothetical protein